MVLELALTKACDNLGPRIPVVVLAVRSAYVVPTVGVASALRERQAVHFSSCSSEVRWLDDGGEEALHAGLKLAHLAPSEPRALRTTSRARGSTGLEWGCQFTSVNSMSSLLCKQAEQGLAVGLSSGRDGWAWSTRVARGAHLCEAPRTR